MGFNNFHLIFLASLVAISLSLIIIGGSISAWCIKVGDRFECHSLFYSHDNFSCLFKLIPTGIIFCLIISLFMFMILIIVNAKKEYQLITRFVNILVLSIAIVLIMIVLLQWFHPPLHASKNILIATVSGKNENNSGQTVFSSISSKDPLYLQAFEAQRRSTAIHHYNINHGPNLFFATFILLLLTLVVFVIVHRVNELI
jgi:amino acid transporter